jgi:hypothetical protein
VSEFGEPVLGFFGQGRLPQRHGPEQNLLGESVRLPRSVPLPEMMGFALEQAERGEETMPNTVIRVGGEVRGRHEALLESIDPLGLDAILQGGEALKRLGDAAGTEMTELFRFILGRQGGGELADEGVEADAMFEEFFDETSGVQLLQGPPQGRGVTGFAQIGHPGEPAQHRRGNGGRFGELPRHPKQEPNSLVRPPQGVPLGLQGGRDGSGVNRLEVDRGQVLDLGVEGGETAFLLEPVAVSG